MRAANLARRNELGDVVTSLEALGFGRIVDLAGNAAINLNQARCVETRHGKDAYSLDQLAQKDTSVQLIESSLELDLAVGDSRVGRSSANGLVNPPTTKNRGCVSMTSTISTYSEASRASVTKCDSFSALRFIVIPPLPRLNFGGILVYPAQITTSAGLIIEIH